MAGMTFSMVVVAGNALMYLVCSEVADRTRFIYVDDREVVVEFWASFFFLTEGSVCGQRRIEIYPLVMTDIAIESGHRNSGSFDYINMVIFHSYVELPEGT